MDVKHKKKKIKEKLEALEIYTLRRLERLKVCSDTIIYYIENTINKYE